MDLLEATSKYRCIVALERDARAMSKGRADVSALMTAARPRQSKREPAASAAIVSPPCRVTIWRESESAAGGKVRAMPREPE